MIRPDDRQWSILATRTGCVKLPLLDTASDLPSAVKSSRRLAVALSADENRHMARDLGTQKHRHRRYRFISGLFGKCTLFNGCHSCGRYGRDMISQTRHFLEDLFGMYVRSSSKLRTCQLR